MPQSSPVRGPFGTSPQLAVIVSLVIGGASGGLMQHWDPIVPGLTIDCDLFRYLGKTECGIVSFEVAETLDRANALLVAWRKADLIENAWLNLIFDFPFIAAYVVLLAMLAQFSLNRLASISDRRFERVGRVVAALMLIAGLLDCYENYNLMRILGTGQPTELWVAHAYWAATIKFRLVFGGAIASLATLALHPLIRRVTGK